MKKLFTALLCATMIFGIGGCSSKNDSNPKQKQQEVKKDPMSFEVFEKMITDKGFKITEKVDMAAQLIGGIQGLKYITDNGDFELYKFDTTTEAYKKAKEEGVITLDGFGDLNVVVNSDYVLLATDVDETIINEFRDY